MTQDNTVKTNVVNSGDQTLLLVKGKAIQDEHEGKSYVKKLAQAILQVIQKHKEANLRCVGAASLNNAIKAIIISSGEAKIKGMNFTFVPNFQTVTFDSESEKTAISLKVLDTTFTPLSDNEKALLLIKGKGVQGETKVYVKKVSQAILQVIQKHEFADLRCVGAAALNNAVKSIIVAMGDASIKGMKLACVPNFQTITFEGSGEKTAILVKVVKL